VITHVTVTLALLALFFFGGHAIHSFTATMLFGVVLVGTYTSIFIAAPILIYLGVGLGRHEADEPSPKEFVADGAAAKAVAAAKASGPKPSAKPATAKSASKR
jgi:preprotein translocase subunit SecF